MEAVLTLLFSWAARSFMIRRFRFTRLRRQIGPIPTCLFHASKTADASRNRSSPAVCKWHADCMPEGAELALQVLFYNLKTQFLTVHLSHSTTRQPQPCYTHSTSSTTGEPGKFLHLQPSLPSNTPPVHASKTSAPPKSPAYQNTTSPRSTPPNAPS